MAPRNKNTMSLNAFLEDTSLGSWADDEVDMLPTAPAPKTDEDRANDRDFGRRDRDYLSSRPDRGPPIHREEIPLPTQPPYTAFVGNLAFGITAEDLEGFFAPHKIKTVKIIKDREDKPKGFGYVEFSDLEGLKGALAKSGSNFSSRSVRVSVAEPQKERQGGFGDDDKFSGPWRRDGPLPERSGGMGGDKERRRFEGAPETSVSDSINDWRSTRAPPRHTEPDLAPLRRKGSGFSAAEGHQGLADNEDSWRSKVVSGGEDKFGSRFGSVKGRGEMGPPAAPPIVEESDWRRGRRTSTSPSNSTPSTPQMGRRKLELLPRTGGSTQPTPLSSPKSATNQNFVRSNPFGAARPVDVTARENAVAERLEKERDGARDRGGHTMSRQSSRQARERPLATNSDGVRTPPSAVSPTGAPSSPRIAASAAVIRPAFSFANAAAKKVSDAQGKKMEEVTEKVSEIIV